MNVFLLELIQKGGMVHYASQLANSLSSQNDMKVSIIVPDGTNCNNFNKDINIKRIPVLGRHPYRSDLILKYLFDVDPDVIHITISHPFLIPILPILKRKNIPIMLTVHDVNPHPGEKHSLITKVTSHITMNFSKQIFVHGDKLKSDLISKQIKEDKIKVIPHGDYSFFNKYTLPEISEDDNTVLYFGRIMDYKGLEYLIKAETLVSGAIPNLKILIAGEGDFSKYQDMIQNKNHFEIINQYIPDDKVAELFQKSAVVVLPYIEASQSGIVPIAYAFKKPVIVTDVGCLKDVVHDNITGYVVPPENIEVLSEAIIKILKDSDARKKMGENAYNMMEENLSWICIAEKIIEYYQESINA